MYKLPSLQELLEAGVHFGHQVRRGHPRMKPYIYGAREGVHVIDLATSEALLKEACEAVYSLGKEGKVLLFVGTKKQAKPIVEELAKKLQAPYMTERWIGGFLTNFEEIRKNIKLLKDLTQQKEKGELAKYTKKEQLLISRRMDKLQRDFIGVMDLERVPEAIFVVDSVSDNVAVREANRLKIKVVAIADSNCNISEIDYPIPGNDDAIKSIKILTETIASAFEEGKKEALRQAQGEQEKAEKAAKKAAAAEALADKEKDGVDEELKEEVAVAEEIMEKKAVKDAEKVV